MIEVKNQFANHAIFWWFSMPLVITLLMPMMLNANRFEIHSDEIAFFKEVGTDTGRTTISTNHLYQAAFIDTGVTKAFGNTFAHDKKDANQKSIGNISSSISRDWNDGLWLMLYRAIWRLQALLPIYIAGLLAFILPAFVDGIVTRGKKRFNYQVHNPVVFYSATHFSVLVLGLAVFIPFLPFVLSSLYIGGFTMTLAGSMWLLASNFQTGA